MARQPTDRTPPPQSWAGVVGRLPAFWITVAGTAALAAFVLLILMTLVAYLRGEVIKLFDLEFGVAQPGGLDRR